MDEIREILVDVREKLKDGIYRNEEHVRLSVVARIVQGLGWDIWNPREVNTEYPAVPDEDATRVDFALFMLPHEPSVYIEVKAIGRLEVNLAQTEKQLRDYNRNNTALFCLITDGRRWRFYYSQTGGEFSNKCFKVLDILETDVEDLELSFHAFLSRSEIASGNAKRDAESYLQSSQKKRAMADALPKARRMVQEPPFPNLPQAMVKLLTETGYSIKQEEAAKYIEEANTEDFLPETIASATPSTPTATRVPSSTSFPPDGTPCRFTYKGKIYLGRIDRSMLIVEGLGRFETWSAASCAITKTSRNGWRDWVIQLAGSSTWLLADDWRRKQR